MEKRIIARGLLAGAIGGVLAFLFARMLLEPVIDRAIAYEEEAAHALGAHEHGVELFTRGVQANIGMGFGVLAFSVAMGALFAVAYCVAYGRVGNISPRLLSVLLAGGMFLSLYVIPFLKYPASPPALSLDDTIQQRTLLYLLMVVLSAVLLVAAVALGRNLAARYGGWSATLIAAGSYAVAVAVVMLVLPSIHETPGDFPADVLYDFRLYSLGTQLVMWATIGLVFAPMVARVLGETRRAEPVSA
jgi:predicted cobalt transporter CbtA